MTCDRVSSDAAGESHFDRIEISLVPTNYAPPAPVLDVSAAQSAEGLVFFRTPAGWTGDFHPTPRRQLLIVLAGDLQIIVSDGEERILRPGSTCLLEDTDGKGHFTKVVGNRDCDGAFVHMSAPA